MPVPRLNRVLGLLVVLMLAGCAVAEPLNGLLPVTALESEAPAVPEQPGLERVGQAVDKDPLSTVQLGYHFKPTQDGTSAATLARQAALIVLTKNDEAFRDELRAAGYQGKILQYILANEVDGPEPGADCDNAFEPWQNQALNRPGEFCSASGSDRGLVSAQRRRRATVCRIPGPLLLPHESRQPRMARLLSRAPQVTSVRRRRQRTAGLRRLLFRQR